MHIVRNQSPIRFPDGSMLAPGEWLCNDDNAFQIGLMAERGSVTTQHWTGADMPAVPVVRSILLIRSGAIGDLLLLTPAIRALRVKYPNAQIWLSCFKRHWDIFAQGDTHFIEYPLPVSELAQFDLVIPLEHVVELSTEKGIHATDAYAEAMGVEVTDYRPVYRLKEGETLALPLQCQRIITTTGWEGKRVALHLQSSSPIRNYPIELWQVVIQTLIERGWEVMLLGNTVTMKGGPKGLRDCSHLSFREAAAVMATCDVFCGVDSSFFNLAPALGVPAIGLFGPVEWRTRVKEGNGQFALHGEGCEPCHWTNSRAGVKMPPLGPCAPKQQCVLLSSIKPERILAVIEREAKK